MSLKYGFKHMALTLLSWDACGECVCPEWLGTQSKSRVGKEVVDGQQLRHESRLGIGGLRRDHSVPEPLVLSTDDLPQERPVEPVSGGPVAATEVGRTNRKANRIQAVSERGRRFS